LGLTVFFVDLGVFLGLVFVTDLGVLLLDFADASAFLTSSATSGVFINSAMPSKFGDAAFREGRALAGVFFTDFGVFTGLFLVDLGVFLGLAAFLSDLGVLLGLAALGAGVTDASFTFSSATGVAAFGEGFALAGVFFTDFGVFAGLFLADLGVFLGLAAFLADLGVFLGLAAFLVDFGVFLGLAVFLVDFGVLLASLTFSAGTGVFINSEIPSKLGVAAFREGRAFAGVFFKDFGVFLGLTAFFVDLGVFLGVLEASAFFTFSATTGVFINSEMPSKFGVAAFRESLAFVGVFFTDFVTFPRLFLADFGVFLGLAAFFVNLGVFLELSETDLLRLSLATLGVFLGLRDLLLIDFGDAVSAGVFIKSEIPSRLGVAAFEGVFLGLLFADFELFLGLTDFLLADFCVATDFFGEAFFDGVLLGVAAFLGSDLGVSNFFSPLSAAGVFIKSTMGVATLREACALEGVFLGLFLADFGVFLGLTVFFLIDFGVEADFLGDSVFPGVILGVAALATFFAGVFLGLTFFDGDFLAAGVFIKSAMPSKLGVSAFWEGFAFNGVFLGLFLADFGVFLGLPDFFLADTGVFLGVAAAATFLAGELLAAGVFIMVEMPPNVGVPMESFFLATGDAFLADLGVPTVALRDDLLNVIGETNISRGMLGV